VTPYERLVAERWKPTRFGESILADRATKDAEEMLREAERFLEDQEI